jgi:hypothetical protein
MTEALFWGAANRRMSVEGVLKHQKKLLGQPMMLAYITIMNCDFMIESILRNSKKTIAEVEGNTDFGSWGDAYEPAPKSQLYRVYAPVMSECATTLAAARQVTTFLYKVIDIASHSSTSMPIGMPNVVDGQTAAWNEMSRSDFDTEMRKRLALKEILIDCYVQRTEIQLTAVSVQLFRRRPAYIASDLADSNCVSSIISTRKEMPHST